MKSQVEKVIWITMFWIMISVFQFLTGYSTIRQFSCDLTGLNASTFLIGSVITGIAAGILGGSFMVFYWQSWLRTMAYGRSLIHILWTFTIIYLIVAFISGTYFNAAQLGFSFLHPEVMLMVFSKLVAVENLQNYIFWMLIVIATLIALLVNDKYGPGIFISFLLGKYFHPKREERIFMFLDLRGSTFIAEKLGEDRYFNFLKDAYRDATPAILRTKGEIYQYVGDEIVISWKKETGVVNANSLRCFQEIRNCFAEKKLYYQENYEGFVPEFKAGLHYGFVMAGEIGIVKRDIAYSGDVLNTTSRIQAKCNDLKVNILISKYLLDCMDALPDMFSPSEVGKIALRGKQESLMLYTV
jgi:adenylate cyclase